MVNGHNVGATRVQMAEARRKTVEAHSDMIMQSSLVSPKAGTRKGALSKLTDEQKKLLGLSRRPKTS